VSLKIQVRHLIVGAVVSVVVIASLTSSGQAQGNGRPLTAENFTPSTLHGFGDRSNSWAQAMTWWHGHLYVGTSRQTLCSSLYAVWEFAANVLGRQFADTYLPYPLPNNPDLSCAPAGADLSMQAEIWRWSPGPDSWLRVFQSPAVLDNPGSLPVAPPEPGKKLPYEIAFRGLTSFVEPDGTDALYAFGVNSTIMWDRSQLPPPRILRTTDGMNFSPLPQTPGTFLGDLPFNPDHSSFRSPTAYKGKLFVLSGPVFGQGSLIASADPAKGDDAWFLAASTDHVFYEMTTFNGWLYLGTFSPLGAGYSVVKTKAEGAPPYTFETVVPPGALLSNTNAPLLRDRPSRSVVSMHVYNGQLYVGTATPTELIRINPDDTWDVVVGAPRQRTLADGSIERKYPLSNLGAGFGHTLNDHAWQMDDPFRYLYVGTYNASISAKDDPVNGPLLAHNMGAHMYRTHDSWYYSAVTTNGFADPADPYGGRFDYGIRTMETTPHGVFVGTANDYYGLSVFRARTRGSSKLDAPDRLEIEPTVSGAPLLSWNAAPKAKTHRVFRAELRRIFIRDDVNFEAWNGISGNKVPDTYIGPYQPVGTTTSTRFVDVTATPGNTYMYYVVGETKSGDESEQSNLVTFPPLAPAVTFASLQGQLKVWEQRQRFKDPARRLAKARGQLDDAQDRAVRCQIDGAIKALNPTRASTDLLEPESTDIEILFSKMVRRLSLYAEMRQDVSTSEFCTQP
jgi:hypothetical protein